MAGRGRQEKRKYWIKRTADGQAWTTTCEDPKRASLRFETRSLAELYVIDQNGEIQ